jgi:hypothetical protein
MNSNKKKKKKKKKWKWVGPKNFKLYILTLNLKFKSNYNKLGRIGYENL